LRTRHWQGYERVVATGTTRCGVADMAAILRDVTPRFEELQALKRQLAS
jgi:hypothetical protein